MSLQSLCRRRSSRSAALTNCAFEQHITSPEELHYMLGKTLGSGTYAKVKAAWSPYERKMIAIKIIEKQGATKEFLNKFLPREIDALQRLSHSNILQVYRLVETEKQVYFMLEIAHNGDLLDYINANRCLPESQARFVMAGISAGIGHCHSRGIIHRDLKCENIMITEDMNIRIGDFGFSRLVDDKSSGASTPCGSFSYAAPELFADRGGSTYDGKKADIWSMGCILYAMVFGRLPFGDDSQVANNVNKPLNFPVTVTEACRNILQFSMLNIDVEMRCNIAQLRTCPWMRGPVATLTPYKNQIHSEEECLPKVILSPIYTDDSTGSTPQPVATFGAPMGRMRSSESITAPPTSPSKDGRPTPTAIAQTFSGTASNTKVVHKRKKTAVARLEQRLRVLNDPTNDVILPSLRPMPVQPTTGMKAKISSAGKKVIQTFFRHSS